MVEEKCLVNAVLVAVSVLNLNGFHRHTLYSLPRPCQFLFFLIGLPQLLSVLPLDLGEVVIMVSSVWDILH